MNYDEAYNPDRRIRDVYEKDWDAKRLEGIGLDPYARIGSLDPKPAKVKVNYHRKPKSQVNFHKFTYISPLIGETLSPAEQKRAVVPAPNLGVKNKLSDQPSAATPVTHQAVDNPKRLSSKTLKGIIVPSAVILTAVGLVVYAAAFQPYGNGSQPLSPAHSSNPYSPPLILDSKNLIPLETLLQNKNTPRHGTKSAAASSSGTGSTPASTQPSGGSGSVPNNIIPDENLAPSSATSPTSSSGVSLPSTGSSSSSASSSTGSGSGGTTITVPSTPLNVPSSVPQSVTVPVNTSL